MAADVDLDDESDPKRDGAALALAGGQSARAAATIADVSVRTVNRWRRDSGFKALVATLRGELLDQAVGAMSRASHKAVATLLKLLDDEDSSIRLRASTALLDGVVKLRDSVEMDRRMTELEEAAAGAKEGASWRG